MALVPIRDVTGLLMRSLGGMFGARALTNMQLSNIVQPVISAEGLIGEGIFETATKDISAGGAVFTEYFAVPEGEVWDLVWVYAQGTTGNGWSVVYQRDGVDYNTEYTTGQETFHVAGSRLRAGDKIGRDTTGNGGDSAILMTIHYVRYMAR